jgi:hypothetical protein
MNTVNGVSDRRVFESKQHCTTFKKTQGQGGGEWETFAAIFCCTKGLPPLPARLTVIYMGPRIGGFNLRGR